MFTEYSTLQTSKPRSPASFYNPSLYSQLTDSLNRRLYSLKSCEEDSCLRHQEEPVYSSVLQEPVYSTVLQPKHRYIGNGPSSVKSVNGRCNGTSLSSLGRTSSRRMDAAPVIQDDLKMDERNKHDYLGDTDQGFTSCEEGRKQSSRIPYFNHYNTKEESKYDGWNSSPGPHPPTSRKITLANYKEMDESPSPLLSGDRKHLPGEEDPPHRTMNQLKKTMNQRKRVIRKGGISNVTYKNISKKKRRYILDLYTTLLDYPWRYLVVLFASSFYLSWLFFAVIYYVICLIHGDLAPDLPDGWVPCILEVDGFPASFLYSLETQHTIGYGTRQTTTECPEAMIFMSIQSVLGCLIQAFMVGIVFSKLSRPSSRSKTVIFSQISVINVRNKKLCLIFRIGDLRDDNFILGTQISAKILRRRITNEGELFQEMQMLKVDPDNANEPCIFFVWPLEIVHVIDESSPLYDLSAAELQKEKFEIVVIMEGTIETSSMTFQARTSYLPSEILWGHRFEPMTLYRKDHNKFQVNFSAFHSTYEVETPLCSARELEQHYMARDLKQRSKSSQRPQNHSVHSGPGGDTSSLHPEYNPYNHNKRNSLTSGHFADHLLNQFRGHRTYSTASQCNQNPPIAEASHPLLPLPVGPRDSALNIARDDESSTDSDLEKSQKKKKRSKVQPTE